MAEPAVFVFTVMFVLPLAGAVKVFISSRDSHEHLVHDKMSRQTLTGMPLRETLQRMGIPALADGNAERPGNAGPSTTC